MRSAKAALAAVAVLGLACATPVPPYLASARDAVRAAESDDAIQRHGAVELYEAKKLLARADQAFEDDEEQETAHLSYLTSQRVQIARERAQQGVFQVQIDQLAEKRSELRLQAREAAAERARAEAALQEARAVAAEREAQERAKAFEAEQQRAAALEADVAAARQRAEELERAIEELNAKKTDRGLLVTLGDVLFTFGRAELAPGSQRVLDRVSEFLARYSDRAVTIEGHTDSVGSDSFNQALSERRAESVARYLASSGVDRSRIRTRGFGESRPLVSNESDAGRQQNRRVEVIIENPPEAPAPRIQ
jgi:outer membrane protein OmpA-like peptidoglycan-associated protein